VDAVNRQLNFNLLARPYRWLEYATFGRALECCRFHFLPELTSARRALVLGDGDGRFLAQLLESNPQLEADAVDISSAMLRLLEKRIGTEASRRVTLHQADARSFVPPRTNYDLVAAHFFFDCLFQPELNMLVARIAPYLAPEACWVVSEFGPSRRWIHQGIVSGLYLAFGVLSGLRVRSLPDHHSAFEDCGFELHKETCWLQGLLMSQLWQR
jgi:SAM-dependent methyltransferase